MWRGGAGAANYGAVEGEAVGDAMPGLRTCAEADCYRRVEASAMHFDLRPEQERSGRDDAALRTHLWRTGGGAAVFQYLRNAAGIVESLYRCSGDFCIM